MAETLFDKYGGFETFSVVVKNFYQKILDFKFDFYYFNLARIIKSVYFDIYHNSWSEFVTRKKTKTSLVNTSNKIFFYYSLISFLYHYFICKLKSKT